MTNAHSIEPTKIKQAKKDGSKGGNRKPMTNGQFLTKARNKHGTRFDYTKTKYIHSQKEMVITCKLHGDFTQVAANHLRSRHGCPVCAKQSGASAKTKTKAQFLKNANKKHNNKYDYSKVDYTGSDKLVVITCPEHGDFQRTPNNHIFGGYGCNNCAGVLDYDTNSFIERAKNAHGADKYDYSQSVYKSARGKVKIVCSTHGVFHQSATEHLKGGGCATCAKEIFGGYSRSDFIRKCGENNNGNALLYVIKCHKNRESFYKVGITSNNLQVRFRNRREMPYQYKVLHTIDGAAGYIYDLEVRLHALLKPRLYNPNIKFRGYTECFTTIKPIERLLEELSSTEQLQLIA